MGELSFLLDTHALLWWLFDDSRLSPDARRVLEEPTNQIFVSSATVWEICTKHRLGKLPSAGSLVGDMAAWVAKAGFLELSVSIAHARKAGNWSQNHRDPFDRMLAAQSVIEDAPLITLDPAFRSFGIRTHW